VIGIFKQNNPGSFIGLLIFGILIKMPIFLHPYLPTTNSTNGILYDAILQYLSASSIVFFPLLAFLLIFIQSILITRVINNNRLMAKPNWFPGMAYMLITSLVPEWSLLSAPLIVNTILLFILSSFFKIYNKADAKGVIFNIGLALGLAVLIFSPAITFLIWIMMGLMLMRPFKLNEWMLLIIGVTTPYYFYAVMLFLTDNWSWHLLIPHFSLHLPSIKQSVWLAGSAFLLLIPYLLGGYLIQDNLRKMLIQVRKGWSLILIYTFGAILIPFVNDNNHLENWIITAIPFAAFHACTYLYSSRRMVPIILFWLTVFFILTYQYSGMVKSW
jgi:hypothetical protein